MSLKVQFELHRNDFRMSLDLDLPQSGVTAIFGPSGSGKTTLLRAIAGLDKIPGGQLSFQGSIWQDETVFIPTHLRPVGYVFQQPGLFSHLNVQQNLEYGLNRVDQSSRQVSLSDAIDLLGIGNLLKRQPDTLSGGEQQRVAIARTLAVSPQLLLMDEPLSSLDNKLKQEILPYLESLQKELSIPIIYVSHATDEVARLADVLVILKSGEVLGTGPVQEMLTRLDLPLSHRKDAETLIHAKVISTDEAFALTSLDCDGNIFTVPGTGLEQGAITRLRIAAHDVSLTLNRQTGTSIQNIYPVTVLELQKENDAQVMIKLQLGSNILLARLTHKSVKELSITSGKNLFAQIKSIAVLA